MHNVAMESAGSASPSKGQIIPTPTYTQPYWRSERHWVDDYRSTDALPEECDVAIIGSGMSGVATTYHMCKLASNNKPRFVILEAREACSGATGRNGGHSKIQVNSSLALIQKHGLEPAETLIAFIRAQVGALKKVVDEEKLDCEFELRRSFDVFCNEAEAKAACDGYAASRQAGQLWTEQVHMLDKEHIEQLLGGLCERGQINLQTSTPVVRVEHDKVSNVLHTARGNIRAKKVVFATNGYTSGICPIFEDRVVPYKGTACHIKPRSPVSPHLANTYNIRYAPGSRVDYLNPRPDSGIVVGGGKWTFEHNRNAWYNNWDDSTQLPEVMPHFENLIQQSFLGWEDSAAQVDMVWTGIMACTPDEMPHVGPVPGSDGGQYVIAGFNGGGMSHIFLAAEGLAMMLVNDIPFAETGLPKQLESTVERLRHRDSQ
ncbi:hypothetical protein LTR78_006702 [Recurvomyces mirabilis]|uniref:FAD dependent oxidoreductase domain-containing protein n=1 Tax=Recurvomyces mirabilis TaxID=574656 RepID=A0AAE0WKN4_9PEZI|nr:hypothetical protein LTR78_006702 [Recurvomyces mirabilis]KAK5151409.1 hypothetical protein LTS14_009252 [Recurvomyces mirabilis]